MCLILYMYYAVSMPSAAAAVYALSIASLASGALSFENTYWC